MKKSTKIIRLSVTLLLLIAMLLTPMSPIFAVVIENGDADLTAADIVSEDASKREKFSRHYLTGDGTYFAVSYAEQVNYQDEDGNWIAVDNSLSTNVLTGEKTTKNEKFKVKFANKANKEDLVTIKTSEYDVSFGITVSEDGESYLELNKVKGTESASNTSAEPKTTQEATSLGKAVSGITYFDAFSDYLDVRYSVAHEKVKEDLILERKSSFSSYKVTYNIKEKDALATLNDDGSITFTNPDGAVLFNVGVPVMYDSDGKSSADIAVSMTQTQKTVEVTYTPSAEWLNAEERVYPVTIDPSVSSSQVTSNIIDTSYSVDSNTEEMAISETLYMGQGYSAFIKINQVADVPVGGTLLGADLVLYGDYGYTNNANNVFRFTIFELTETWNEYALSGDNLPERNISNARVYDNPSHQTSIGDDFIQFTFNLSNDLWESDGFNDYFENYNGFEIYLDHNSYFEAYSGEYPTVELRPCIRTRYSAPSINSVNSRSTYSLNSENNYGTLVGITTGKEYRLLNTSSQDYITYSDGSVILSDYIQESISQKISFYYNTIVQSHSIMLTNGNEYLYYYVDSEGALTYTVWTTTSVVNDYDRWKIYNVSGDLVIASAADEQYVLADANGTLIVTSYAYGDYSQLWSTELFNHIFISELDIDRKMQFGDEFLIKTIYPATSYISNNPSVATVSSNGIVNIVGYGEATIRINTSVTYFTIDVYVYPRRDKAVLMTVKNYEDYDFNLYANSVSAVLIQGGFTANTIVPECEESFTWNEVIAFLDTANVMVISAHGNYNYIYLSNNAHLGIMLELSVFNNYPELDLSNIDLLVLSCCATGQYSTDTNEDGVITSIDWATNNGPRNILEKFVALGAQTVIGFNQSIDAEPADNFVKLLFKYLYDYTDGTDISYESRPGLSVREAIECIEDEHVNNNYSEIDLSGIFDSLVIGGTDETVLYLGE